MAVKRAVTIHALVWGVLAVVPYVALMAWYWVSELPTGVDSMELVNGSLWVGFFVLVPSVITAGLFGGIDIGVLVAFRRARFNHWARAAIPAVAVLLVAMGIFSAYVYLTNFNLYGTGHYYGRAAVAAGVLALGVYTSHAWHYRSIDTE